MMIFAAFNLSWVEFSIILVVLVFSALLIATFVGSFVNHKKRMPFAPMLACLLIAGWSFFGIRADDSPTAITPVAHAITAKAESASDPTLDALWDQITKSRINLDGADDSAPLADPKDEVAKEAVKKFFGLDEQGELPPNWVIHPPKRVGKVLRESVASDPFVTQAECRRQLEEEQLPQIVARQIGYLASARLGHAVKIDDPLSVGVGLDYIFREICRDEFTTTIDSSVGDMKKVHVLVEFNPKVDQYLLDSWLRQERHQRLASFGKLFAMSITGLAAVYGLLRFDTWSKGYYSKQLLVGGVLAIIAVAVFLLRVS